MTDDQSTHDFELEIERTCAILERVAGRYPEGSEEEQAIRTAAEAYVWLNLHQHLKATYTRLRSLGGELSEDHKQNLRDMGIDPDDPEYSD